MCDCKTNLKIIHSRRKHEIYDRIPVIDEAESNSVISFPVAPSPEMQLENCSRNMCAQEADILVHSQHKSLMQIHEGSVLADFPSLSQNS